MEHEAVSGSDWSDWEIDLRTAIDRRTLKIITDSYETRRIRTDESTLAQSGLRRCLYKGSLTSLKFALFNQNSSASPLSPPL